MPRHGSAPGEGQGNPPLPNRPLTRGERIGRAYRSAIVRNQRAERAAREHRETDPVERAKTWLRRNGAANVYNGSVVGLSRDLTVVDGYIFTTAELFDHVEWIAARRGQFVEALHG